MSEISKPTQRFGRTKKDPRMDSVPPPPLTPQRSVPPSTRSPSVSQRMSEGMLPRVAGRRAGAFPDEPKTSPTTRLEDLLARERAEREQDADRLGELLGRATRAEAERQKLLERLADVEARLAAAERALAGQGAPARRKHDSVPTLASARVMAAELARVLERVRDRNSTSDLPAPKSIPAPKSSSRG